MPEEDYNVTKEFHTTQQKKQEDPAKLLCMRLKNMDNVENINDATDVKLKKNKSEAIHK